MSDRMVGRVALITGAARGQGRSHAVRLAEEGADIIGVDICGPVGDTADFYPPATPDDLAETVALVESAGGRMFAAQADVRDFGQLADALDRGTAELGPIDAVIANAGIHQCGDLLEDTSEKAWRDVFDVNVAGVFHTCKAAVPHLEKASGDRSIVITSSAAGVKGFARIAHYTASKHAVVGLMRSLAVELGPRGIRANVVAPANTDTPMIQNEATYRLFVPEKENPTREDFEARCADVTLLPFPWVAPEDVSNAVLFLASGEAGRITGQVLAVDAGVLAR